MIYLKNVERNNPIKILGFSVKWSLGP